MASVSVVPLFRRFHEKGMTLDTTMLTALGVLFTIDRQYLDPTAIRTELGWEPKWELERGLRAAWEWYERTLA